MFLRTEVADVVITQDFYPTIYALNDAHPIAVCKGSLLPDGSPIPDGERTYTNSCTIKVSHQSGRLEEGADRSIAWVVWRTVSTFGRLLRRRL